MFFANLLHLSFNMWEDHPGPPNRWRAYHPRLRFDDALWRELTGRMADAGADMLVLDLGDGVRYETHPEIAVEGAWTRARLAEELARLRDLGIEPVPKLNFSAAHDTWLGPWARRVSTPEYYGVCRDLIAEVADLFGRPRLFHIGMDEETAHDQRSYQYVVVRQGELWWHDLLFLAGEVTRTGSRPWVWSDAVWRHPDEFLDRIPRTVLQSNWYYGTLFDDEDDSWRPAVGAYRLLDEHGFDQVPTASNIGSDRNFPLTVSYCRNRIDPARLHGFLQTPWYPTLSEYREKHLAAIDQIAAARREVAPDG
jgi:hypothetical protein